MTDAVTSHTIYDGPGRAVMKFTNISDGSGETAVTKVDVSALQGSPSEVVIERLIYSTAGMAVQLLWDATTDVLAWVLPSDRQDDICFPPEGLQNNAGAGKTGDLLLTTSGASSGDSYSIYLVLRKRS